MKKIKVILLTTLICLSMTACSTGNQEPFVENYNFEKAMKKLADDTVITVDVDNYTFDSNSIIIATKDGKLYGCAYTDVTMIGD